MDKLIINAAITGMVPTKAQSPHVPITVDEIVADVKRCRDAGASIVHIHARRSDGSAAYESDYYLELYGRIRAICPDILISGSTSGRVYKEFGQRAQAIDLPDNFRPDFGSLTLGSLNFPQQASMNEPSMIQALAVKMNELGISPEWECFDLGMIDYAHYLISRDVLKPPYYCNLFLGSLGTLNATPHNLTTMVRALPSGTTWSAAGIGRYQFFVNSMAITMGGHVRVGLEDNLYFDSEKNELATNARLIERLVKLATAAGRAIASPNEARQIIGMATEPFVPVVNVASHVVPNGAQW